MNQEEDNGNASIMFGVLLYNYFCIAFYYSEKP